MRKGCRSADARLIFFENELLYCKLTVASDIQKGLLHVSFGVVQSRCRCALKKAFLYRWALHELKNSSFPQTKSFPFTESLRTALKSFSFSQPKHRLFEPFFTVRKSCLFTYKKLSFAQAVPCLFQKPPIFTNQKFFFCTNLFYCHQKQSFSTLHLPFAPPLTYCLQRIQLFF